MVSSKKLSVVAVMMMMMMVIAVDASSFTAWGGPGCNNKAERYSKCGCSAIHQKGGYDFSYSGQTAALYNQAGCSGVAHTRFGASARACDAFGWKSIFIQC